MVMNIQENISLANYSTMRLGGKAHYLADATTEKDIEDLVIWAHQKNVPLIVIGQGSNIVCETKAFRSSDSE